MRGNQSRADEFAAYVVARRSYLRRTAYLVCGDWHFAEDLVQTALVKLYTAWPRIRRDGAEDAYAPAGRSSGRTWMRSGGRGGGSGSVSTVSTQRSRRRCRSKKPMPSSPHRRRYLSGSGRWGTGDVALDGAARRGFDAGGELVYDSTTVDPGACYADPDGTEIVTYGENEDPAVEDCIQMLEWDY